MAGHGRERGDARRRSRAQATRVAGSCRCVPRVLTASALVLCLATGLAGCGQASSFRVPAPSPDSAKLCGGTRKAALCGLTVGYVGVGDTEGERAAQMERATIIGLRTAGVHVKVFRSLSLNPQPQITAAQSFADQGIDALIVDPQFSNVWGDAFATIRDQGIKVILLDRTPLGMAQSRYDAYLGSNYQQLGEQMAQWVLGRLGRWTGQDATFEDGGVPRSLIVSSLLGSSPDNKAADGWADKSGWLMQTLDSVAVGEDHATALRRLSSSWDALSKAKTLPHVIFATNQTAASVTIDLLKNKKARLVTDPARAMRLDASRGTKDPWAVAVVCLAGRDWIERQTGQGSLSAGIAIPTDYSSRLVTLLTRLCAGIPTAKDEVVAGTLVTASRPRTSARQ